MDKNKILIQKTITIVLVVALLFTTGFVLGAVTAEIKELNAPVVEQVTESTTVPTTEAPTTEAPTTQAPTTAAPTTTEAPTETTTTEPSTEATTETTTTEAATEETTEEEPCLLVKILLGILDIKKKIIDFVISILSSL